MYIGNIYVYVLSLNPDYYRMSYTHSQPHHQLFSTLKLFVYGDRALHRTLNHVQKGVDLVVHFVDENKTNQTLMCTLATHINCLQLLNTFILFLVKLFVKLCVQSNWKPHE